jgi:hypothetical protein
MGYVAAGLLLVAVVVQASVPVRFAGPLPGRKPLYVAFSGGIGPPCGLVALLAVMVRGAGRIVKVPVA